MTIKKFTLQLTEKQRRLVIQEWTSAGKEGGAMLMAQPIINFGHFGLKPAFLRFAVIDKPMMTKVQRALDSGR